MLTITVPTRDSFAPTFDVTDFVLEIDRQFPKLEADVEAARESGDVGSIAFMDQRLRDVRELRAKLDGALASYKETDTTYRAACARVVRASSALVEGTLEANIANAQYAELIAACAEERYRRAELASAKSPVTVALSGLRKVLETGLDAQNRADVFRQTESYAARLLDDYTAVDEVVATARSNGEVANARLTVWWPIAETVVAKAFPGDRRMAGELMRVRNLPDQGDLERCFAARRAGLEGARRSVASQLAELGGA